MNKKQVALFLFLLQNIIFSDEDFCQNCYVFNSNNGLFTGTFFRSNPFKAPAQEEILRHDFVKKVILENKSDPDQVDNSIIKELKENFRDNFLIAFKETEEFVLDYQQTISLDLPEIRNIRFLNNPGIIFDFYMFDEDATFEPVGLLAKPETEA